MRYFFCVMRMYAQKLLHLTCIGSIFGVYVHNYRYTPEMCPTYSAQSCVKVFLQSLYCRYNNEYTCVYNTKWVERIFLKKLSQNYEIPISEQHTANNTLSFLRYIFFFTHLSLWKKERYVKLTAIEHTEREKIFLNET